MGHRISVTLVFFEIGKTFEKDQNIMIFKNHKGRKNFAASRTPTIWHRESNAPVGNLFFEIFFKKTFRPKISNSVSVFWDLPLSGTVSFWHRESPPPVGNLFLEVFFQKMYSLVGFALPGVGEGAT